MESTTSPVQRPLEEIATPDPGALFRKLSSGPGGLNSA